MLTHLYACPLTNLNVLNISSLQAFLIIQTIRCVIIQPFLLTIIEIVGGVSCSVRGKTHTQVTAGVNHI